MRNTKWSVKLISAAIVYIAALALMQSCQKDYVVPFPVPQPITAQETENLEAQYVSNAPLGVNSSYWRTADFLTVELSDININDLPNADGLLNVNGTYQGLDDFNEGEEAEVYMRAAYDSTKLYLLIEWTDSDVDASRSNLLYNGNEDPLRPSQTAAGWTSQRNDDQVSLVFDLESSSGAAGSFVEVGCAATCHNGEMKPSAGKVDIWNWSLALSEPLGYALDMQCSSDSGLISDYGQPTYVRNAMDNSFRSPPQFEWDGTVQAITRADGSQAILDPAFYLYNKMNFVGDAQAGISPYVQECGATCHGVNGEGDGPDLSGPAFNKPGVMNRFSREIFDTYSSSFEHSGFTKYNTLTASERDDVIALIRGFSGVPGYYLQQPDGSNDDIMASSNVLTAKISPEGTTYKLMLVRDLNTNNTDDVVFDLANELSYTFGIAFMDADSRNHVGSLKETLIFIKP